MVRLNLDQLKSSFYQNAPRIPKAIGMITFGSAGVWIARECCLLARDCTKSGLDLSSHILSQKGLESVNPSGIMASSLITKCHPNFYHFAALSLGASASCLLAYRFAREMLKPIKPEPPASASPHRAKKTE